MEHGSKKHKSKRASDACTSAPVHQWLMRWLLTQSWHALSRIARKSRPIVGMVASTATKVGINARNARATAELRHTRENAPTLLLPAQAGQPALWRHRRHAHPARGRRAVHGDARGHAPRQQPAAPLDRSYKRLSCPLPEGPQASTTTPSQFGLKLRRSLFRPPFCIVSSMAALLYELHGHAFRKVCSTLVVDMVGLTVASRASAK